MAAVTVREGVADQALLSNSQTVTKIICNTKTKSNIWFWLFIISSFVSIAIIVVSVITWSPCNGNETDVQFEALKLQVIPGADCEEIKLQNPASDSGVYEIFSYQNGTPVSVYCDMELAGGGWTVIQRRVDGSEDFNRNWSDYQLGFGDPSHDYWLGNEVINYLTEPSTRQGKPFSLLVKMTDRNGVEVMAVYENFYVESESKQFTLRLGKFVCGNGGNSLANRQLTNGLWNHNGQPFSTKDRDNSAGKVCASSYRGGWWYNACLASNLNGLFGVNGWKGIIWYTYGYKTDSMATSTMMIRRQPKYQC